MVVPHNTVLGIINCVFAIVAAACVAAIRGLDNLCRKLYTPPVRLGNLVCANVFRHCCCGNRNFIYNRTGYRSLYLFTSSHGK